APDGQRLLAAAPLIGDWVPFGGNRLLLLSFFSSTIAFNQALLDYRVVLVGYVAVLAVILGWIWRWRRHHPKPTGMAATLGGSRSKAPVLVVTDAAVLLTESSRPRLGTTRIRPAGVGRPLPGLVALDAEGERLVARFEDGSETALRARSPRQGAAAESMAEVARLAAPAVRRQREAAPAERRRQPW
ncbi:MAG: hypothetical protein ABIS47_09790, partial [Acidimicrobiales bacterium]